MPYMMMKINVGVIYMLKRKASSHLFFQKRTEYAFNWLDLNTITNAMIVRTDEKHIGYNFQYILSSIRGNISPNVSITMQMKTPKITKRVVLSILASIVTSFLLLTIFSSSLIIMAIAARRACIPL